MPMKFSVITPSFNQGRFIKDCIESVLAQSGGDFEVEHIVMDAGSTDETLDVLEQYPHLKWTSEPDGGMSDGINKGFLRASGDWLMWLNCDDYLLPEALAWVADFIALHPEADVVHGDCFFVREDKTVMRRKFDHPVSEFTLLYAGCFIPSTSTFLKRKIIDDGHLIDTSYKVCMDWEYYLRLLRLNYKFSYLPEALASFRWHETNTSSVHAARGVAETYKLQCEHLETQGHPTWLKNPLMIRLLHVTAKASRVLKRVATHGRIR